MLHGRLSFLSFVTTIYLVVATGDSQLTSLSPKYRAAPWKRFTDPKDKVQLFSKQPGEDFTVAVLKVTVVTKVRHPPPLDPRRVKLRHLQKMN